MLRTLALVLFALMLGTTVVAVAPATADTLPQCATITDLNCTGTFQNVRVGLTFEQTVNGVTTTSDVWPFRNPTMGSIASHYNDATMFPADYSWLRSALDAATKDTHVLAAEVNEQSATIGAQAEEIDRQGGKIIRLTDQIARLRERIAHLRAARR